MASNDGKLALDPQNEQLCHGFADITGTDPELAVYYLQQKSWKLEDAVNMFFDNDQPVRPDEDVSRKAADGRESSHDGASSSQVSTGSSSQDTVLADQKGKVSTDRQSQPPGTSQVSPRPPPPPPPSPGFRLITWNIDGLDEDDIEERTLAICSILKSYSPDIVFLQEVVPETCPVICAQLSNYKPLPASDRAYFTLILLKKSTVTCLSSKIEPFPESGMGRALQIVECKCAGVDLRLMTSHLESTGKPAPAKERQKQFLRALYLMKTAPAEKTVLFGGDTNLRDKEVVKVGVPTYVRDVWEMCGSPPAAKYTWDLTKNDNLDWPHPNRPRLRFDRLFLRHAKNTPRVEPLSFALLGTERLESCDDAFPSDHWGIVCDFKATPLPDNTGGSPFKKVCLSANSSTGAPSTSTNS